MLLILQSCTCTTLYAPCRCCVGMCTPFHVRTAFPQAVGSIASAWFGGWLVELLGPRPVLLLAAVFPAGVAATAFMITEHRVDGLRKHEHEGANFIQTIFRDVHSLADHCTP